jgi:hypothetical protein
MSDDEKNLCNVCGHDTHNCKNDCGYENESGCCECHELFINIKVINERYGMEDDESLIDNLNTIEKIDIIDISNIYNVIDNFYYFVDILDNTNVSFVETEEQNIEYVAEVTNELTEILKFATTFPTDILKIISGYAIDNSLIINEDNIIKYYKDNIDKAKGIISFEPASVEVCSWKNDNYLVIADSMFHTNYAINIKNDVSEVYLLTLNREDMVDGSIVYSYELYETIQVYNVVIVYGDDKRINIHTRNFEYNFCDIIV